MPFFIMLYLRPEVHNSSKDQKLEPNRMHVTDQWFLLLLKRNFYQELSASYSSTPNYIFFFSSLSTNGTDLRIFYK